MHFPALFSLPDRPRTSSFPGSFTDCILKSAVLCLPCFLFEYWNYSKKTMFSISMLHLVLSVFWFAAVPVFLKFLPILKEKQEKLLWETSNDFKDISYHFMLDTTPLLLECLLLEYHKTSQRTA